jgi:hypothetical protein
LVHTGDVEAYREHCRKVRRQFSDTTEPVLAERMAKACCLLPPSVEDFEVIRQWAETGVNVDPPPPWSMLARGIAEYRQGRFEAAVEWAPKGYPCRGDYIEATAQPVIAMAQYRLNRTEPAHAALAAAAEAMRKMPALDSRDLEDSWEFLMSHDLLREAQALILGKVSRTLDPLTR